MTDERLRRLLDRACEVVPETLTEVGYKREIGTCILSTRIATLVLRELGVRARPLACQLMAGNEVWARVVTDFLEREGRWPTHDEWEPGMWAVGVGYGEDPRANRPGYDGHLIAVVEERYGLDLTRDQTSRPQRGFTVEPGYFPVTPEFLRGELALPLIVDDAYLRYDAWPEERSFLNAPDWREPARQRSSRAVPIRRIHRQLSRP